MNKFTRHIPRCVEIDTSKTKIDYEFASKEEFFSLEPIVISMSDDLFSHFAIKSTSKDNRFMIVKMKNDGTWWVVGYVESNMYLNFPECNYQEWERLHTN